MRDIMLDLETLSTDSNGLIVSIGAVEFDIETGKYDDIFYIKLNILEQAVNGAIIDAETLQWWSTQSQEAKKQLTTGREVSISYALSELNKFIDNAWSKVADIRLWGNGAGFDNVLLRNLYKREGIEFIAPFWCDCDLKSYTNFMTYTEKQAIKFEGIKHSPVDDCLHQIKLLIAARSK